MMILRLRDQFFHVVKYDVQSLDRITEKLLNFANKRSYRFEYGDINSVIYRSTSTSYINKKILYIDIRRMTITVQMNFPSPA